MVRSFPFAAPAYYSLFETYNQAIWPAQIVAYVLGLVLVGLALRPVAGGGRIALAVLALFWLWNGVAYHLLYFLGINFAAAAFGVLFILQGVLFAVSALGRGREIRFRAGLFGWGGLLLALFALVLYPLLGWLAGHGWPQAAVFGVAPAPTTIFTFGVLLMLERAPLYLAIVPLLWALAAGTAAVMRLGTPEDAALLVAGVVGSALLAWRRWR
jgi:hypothetical protein